jgi:hypothetical protein
MVNYWLYVKIYPVACASPYVRVQYENRVCTLNDPHSQLGLSILQCISDLRR